MAAIVYLDVDDEITSAAARLRALTDDRIALVLPLSSRLATSRINFRLLAREATSYGKTLEIVTGDASTRALAATAGLVTHPSVAAFEGRPETVLGASAATKGAGAGVLGAAAAGGKVADDAPTAVVRTPASVPTLRPPKTREPLPQVGRKPAQPMGRRVAVVLAVIAILVAGVVAGYNWLPNATVRIVPAVDKIGPIQLNVTAQSGVTQPDPTRLLVPSRTFSFDLDVSDTFPASGVKVDETSAHGVVTFQNCDTGGSVSIPNGSRVSTPSGVLFTTQARVTIRRAHIFPFSCETSDVEVVAVPAGLSGNVPAGSITRISAGYDPVVLQVTNQAPTTGGTHTETKIITQADVDAATAALNDKLAAAFDDKVAAAEGIPAGTTVFPETKALGTATPSVDPKTLAGTARDTFDLGLTAKGTVVGVDPSPVSTLADARIRSSVKDGYTLVEDFIKIEVGTPLVTGSTITFPVIATAAATRDLDVSILRLRIHGLGLPQARTVLAEYGSATITVWPDWVTSIPTSDDRLSFTIAASDLPGASAGPSGATGGASSSPAAPAATTAPPHTGAPSAAP